MSWWIDSFPHELHWVRLGLSYENKSHCLSANSPSKQSEWHKTMVCSYEGSRQEKFMWCQAASFSGSWPGTHNLRCTCSFLWRYLMPRCTRTERQCLALFVPGSPAMCPQTNGSLCAALQHAHRQQYCIQSFLEHRWAINWFWRKQKWKWGHSHKLLTQELS